ncbi:hypothetical protein, partial [Paenibacillus sp. Y412MC10]|uniref:hypothetical protein n=1 Tax=Geobacillus sp. (strain Y412MC10) TaxID=481743 RepID=UPI001C9314CC
MLVGDGMLGGLEGVEDKVGEKGIGEFGVELDMKLCLSVKEVEMMGVGVGWGLVRDVRGVSEVMMR